MITFAAEQCILVTGAGSGIGRALALQLNSLGATVIAAGRTEAKLLDAQQLAQCPERWFSAPIDLLDKMDDLPQWLAELRVQHGKLWGMAHCAGEGLMDTLQSCSLEQARRHFDLNFHVPVALAKGFADRRNFTPGGAMLFLSSASAIYPEKGHFTYGAAKAALAAAMAAASKEMAPRKLRVHCLAPGLVETPMTIEDDHKMGGTYLQEQKNRYPLGLGSASDVASFAVYLLSAEARWLTGHNYVMGGGCY